MLGSVIVLYASTAVYMGVQMAYFVAYARLLSDAVTGLSSEASTSSTAMSVALTRFGQSARSKGHIISLVLAVIVGFILQLLQGIALLTACCQVTLGDTIVWWRVCVLWPQKLVLALGIGLITSTFGRFL